VRVLVELPVVSLVAREPSAIGARARTTSVGERLSYVAPGRVSRQLRVLGVRGVPWPWRGECRAALAERQGDQQDSRHRSTHPRTKPPTEGAVKPGLGRPPGPAKPRDRALSRAEQATPRGPLSGVKSEAMSEKTRLGWDQYFMAIGRVVATRSTCDRKHVGAVMVRDRMILATGYNGSIRGLPHCDDEGHMMEDGHCVRTVHAEANAIVQAARNGVRLEGADIYVTASPCFCCFKLVANAGVRRIVFGEFYRDQRIFELSSTLGIELIHLPIESIP
jgi:dCMP deaminase